MNCKGDYWDNALMESFWGKMKLGFVDKTYDTLDEARSVAYEYVWSFYAEVSSAAARKAARPTKKVAAYEVLKNMIS